jgi:hypothetical protein
MNCLKLLIITLFLTVSSLQLSAQQIKAFSRDSVKFFNELTDMMVEIKKRDAKRFMDKEFLPTWYSGRFSFTQREKIYTVADEMLSNRMKAYPDFERFVLALMSFHLSEQSDETFDTWMNIAYQMISNKRDKKNFSNFLVMSAYLFRDNTIYESASTQWKALRGDFQMIYQDELIIKFDNLDLICYTKGDSSIIYDTKGHFQFNSEKWFGERGKVTWERSGLPAEEAYVTFNNYEVRLKSSNYTIDSVLFYNPYFDEPLIGILREKVRANVDEESASYPRFESYDKRLLIKDIFENVDYEGGFSMAGGKLLGFGTREEPALLKFYRNGDVFLTAYSGEYTIRTDRIQTQSCKIKIDIEEDSIIHPAVQLRFLKDDRMLNLIRSDEGLSQSPFYNSFHKLDMVFEALYWKIDDPIIEMGNLFGSTDHSARFESLNFYQESIYDHFQAMRTIHPLVEIKQLTTAINSQQFHISELSRQMRLPEQQVKFLLLQMAVEGFLIYDIDSDNIIVKDKLYDYVSSKAGRSDFDVIIINSDISTSKNASLNLLNYDLTIRGVKQVMLSDSNNVSIFPRKGEILVRKNRDMTFGGKLTAGKMEYYGKEYTFSYEDFKINLLNVDSMKLWAEKFDDNNKVRKVKSTIEGIRGYINIDHPLNKSGYRKEDYQHHPTMTITKESYVFYDNRRIQKGAYDRSNFYFKIDPYVMDSLNIYTNNMIGFKGSFVSGDIFPDFEETLTLQDDYSLGFKRPAPEEGFPLYAGNARFKNEIQLSHDGLQGDGEIEFLSSLTKSEKFTFFPDSLTGKASEFNNEEQGPKLHVPKVYAEDVFVKYVPGDEVLEASKIKKSLKLFNDQAELHGKLTLTHSGMTAKGMVDFNQAELESDLMVFKERTIDSDTAAFRMKSFDLSDLAFKTDNVNAHIDFDQRVGEFKSNGEESFVEFPANKYICYMDKFKWFMDQDELELEAGQREAADMTIDTDLDLSGPNFYSVHPNQDSLGFMAPKARYDMKSSVITANEVPFIDVADARITPTDGVLIIEKNAKMRTIKNATIVANMITKHHTIFEASVNIFAKRNYAASGKYNYVDENKMKQTIQFNNITVDTTYQTYASGKILESDNFTLSPNFEYYGEVNMYATNPNMTFSGNTRIIHDCQGISRNWLNFTAEIDPNKIYIPVDKEMKDHRSLEIAAGMVLNDDSLSVYSSFLSEKRRKKHPNIISAHGFLFFDKNKQEYQISNKEKLKEISLPGNYVSINTNECEIYGNGTMDFNAQLGQVKVIPIGEAKHRIIQNEFSMNAAMTIDFFFSEEALEKMADEITKNFEAEPIDFGKRYYENAIKELVGLEEGDKIVSELSLKGSLKRVPKEMVKSLFLAEVNFEWNHKTRTFQSVGPIGIGNVMKKQVYKYVGGYIEVEKKKSGDVIQIYLEVSPSHWYFFSYTKGLMQVLSSSSDFNQIINDLKPDKKKYKPEKGEEPFKYMLSTPKKLKDFQKRFRDRETQEEKDE